MYVHTYVLCSHCTPCNGTYVYAHYTTSCVYVITLYLLWGYIRTYHTVYCVYVLCSHFTPCEGTYVCTYVYRMMTSYIKGAGVLVYCIIALQCRITEVPFLIWSHYVRKHLSVRTYVCIPHSATSCVYVITLYPLLGACTHTVPL